MLSKSTPWLGAFPDYLLDVNRLCQRFGTSQLCLFLLKQLQKRAWMAFNTNPNPLNAMIYSSVRESVHHFQQALSAGIAEQG